MPIYEFQCTECKDIFEELVPVGTKTYKCPSCGARAKKLISQVGIIFKGSGWYCTDNRSASGNGNGHKKKEPLRDEPVKTDEKVEKVESTTSSEKSSKKKDDTDD